MTKDYSAPAAFVASIESIEDRRFQTNGATR